MKLIPIGETTISLDLESWDSHGRNRFEIKILCSDNPFSDYDSIRDFKPSLSEVNEAIDWIIENENQPSMKGYTQEQLITLKNEIDLLITQQLKLK